MSCGGLAQAAAKAEASKETPTHRRAGGRVCSTAGRRRFTTGRPRRGSMTNTPIAARPMTCPCSRCREVEGVPVEVLVEELEADGGQRHPAADGPDPRQTVRDGQARSGDRGYWRRSTADISSPTGRLPAVRGRRHPLSRNAHHAVRVPACPASSDDVASITAAVARTSTGRIVAVHGPPGTGKTYTAARVIKSLVNDHGWSVGRRGTVALGRRASAQQDRRGRGRSPALVAKKASGDVQDRPTGSP